jgi:hypothetical protein
MFFSYNKLANNTDSLSLNAITCLITDLSNITNHLARKEKT